MAKKKYKRRIKLIKPKLQLWLVGGFLALTVLGMLMQSLLLGTQLSELAGSLPADGSLLAAAWPMMIARIMGYSLLVILPLSLAVGVLLTFRIAGPVYRLERYCEMIERGEQPKDCRLRDGDQLVDLCERINRATAPLRERPAEALVEERSAA